MIGLKGVLNVIDNTGALTVECINVLKVKTKLKSTGFATVGDEIVCVVKKARPIPTNEVVKNPNASSNIQKIRKGDVRRAVVVRTKKTLQRPDGSVVRFDDSAAVLLNNKGDMLGTRIVGAVAGELRKIRGGAAGAGGRWGKILMLAPKVSLCRV
ncbi:ribosomal protein L14 [Cryptococcus wingfieldii CBS 7118]|uniref:Large ribosomal subunit protein uL14m n=2 Tax=Cryptococcus TaxID=5206 RepID=A0A1E3K3A5_9TREE|nr:ribosomal protein L14 [Cryptococcus wingfieldii CBS 7118]ODO07516.1 ribosomal protein L14 [Cryptococcus wingfieldii CBS 7118]ODO11999.1 ribosomal protein L14 [Cryptococcus amylolentus CBS 6273]